MTLRALIQERIRDQVPSFREVKGAADLGRITEGRVSSPGCYVYLERRRASPNELDNAVSHRVVDSYGVVVANKNVADARGNDSMDELDALLGQVSDALLGWQPDADSEPLEYAGGQLVSFAGGYVLWRESYTTARCRRAV